MVTRLRELRPRQIDRALAIALSIVLVVELSVENNIDGPWIVNFGLGLVVTGALAWRRSWPVWVVVAQLAALILQTALGGDLLSNPFAPFFSLLVGFYSVGAFAPDPWSGRALGFGVLGVLLVNVIGGHNRIDDYAFPLIVLMGAPWLAGRAAHAWAERARELTRLNRKLQAEQDQRALLAVSNERARIARELHDVVAHSISVMVVQSEGAKRMMERDPKRAQHALENVEATGRSALAEMRRLLGVLRKDDEDARLAPQPGTAALDVLIDRAHEAGLDVDVALEGEKRALPAGVDVSVYRIIQEALTNVLKHAGPVHADVVVRYLRDEVEVEVFDSGPANGFVPPAADPDNPRHGILGMEERVKMYGGKVEVGPSNGGFRVWARIPLGSS